MKYTSALESLIEAFKCLPGVGRKSAQRMALYLLERDRPGAANLSASIQEAINKVGKCIACRNFSEMELCGICRDARRDHETICVVESPADLFAFEQSGTYKGLYYILMGHLSPLDGIGPEDIGLDELKKRVLENEVKEVILATNPTIEGEATAFYVTKMLQNSGAEVSRIAHGVPLGGELEYVDANTLAHALSGRRLINN